MVTAANGQQFASEVKTLGHGILTFAMLEGLKGKASETNSQTVRVRELLDWVKGRVPALSREYRNRDQYPEIYGRGPNFALAVK